MQIEGRRVLVTGASRGLGRTLAFAFADVGAREVLAGVRTEEDFQRFATQAKELLLDIKPVMLDVTVEEMVNHIAQMGTIDILINNAGVAGFGNPLTMNFADVTREVEVNYLGAIRMARAVASGMIRQREGMIVNIATAFAKINLPLVGTYCATKAALLSLGQALRAYLSETGVRVITVMPTTIDTDMSRGADVPKMTKEYVAAQILKAIREETYDPPIGEEAEQVLMNLERDPRGLELALAKFRN